MKIVVFSCGDLGSEVSRDLSAVPGVSEILLVRAPYRHPRRGLIAKLRRSVRMDGVSATVAAVARRLILRAPPPRQHSRVPATAAWPGAVGVHDFHDAECASILKEFRPDLGVIAGTYILREEVFGVPRLGSINIHTGKVPEYRGAAPGFWELFNGEKEIGVTIHRVATAVDAGDILADAVLPLDTAPAGDPFKYLTELHSSVLLTEGRRLLSEVVQRLAAGETFGSPQDAARAKTYRLPTFREKEELRRRVRARLRGR